MTIKGAMIAASVAGMFTMGAATSAFAGDKKGEEITCSGVNACKGQGSCHGNGHACAGKNGCKGQGNAKMTKEECVTKGGKIAK